MVPPLRRATPARGRLLPTARNYVAPRVSVKSIDIISNADIRGRICRVCARLPEALTLDMRQKRRRTTPAAKAPAARTPAYRHGTLGWLAASVAFKEGYDSAVNVLKDYLPATAYQDWSIIHEAQGFSTLRTEVTAATDITYLSYDPPDLWGPSYSVLKATFAPRRARSEFMSHSGEEALIPIDGRIQYHFAWTPGSRSPEVHLTPVLERGSAIRLASQVPHHTWATGQAEASAWMVFRPSSESPTAISVSTRHLGRSIGVGKTGFTRAQVLNPVTYALLAWGIAEQTRLFRDRANIGVSTLASLCHVDAAQISRIEAASQNVSVEAIARLARFLRFPLPQLIAQARSSSGSSSAFPTEASAISLRRRRGGRCWRRRPACRTTCTSTSCGSGTGGAVARRWSGRWGRTRCRAGSCSRGRSRSR